MAHLFKITAAGVSAGIFLAFSASAIERQPADARFSLEAAMNTMSAIQMGELAEQRSPSDQVRQYGQRMMSDYDSLHEQVKSIVARENFAVSDSVGEENQSTIDLLTEISGPPPLAQPAFDQVYISEMIGAHKIDIAAFEEESAHGANPDLRNWAARALPVLREHLRLAQAVQNYLGSVSQVLPKDRAGGKW